LFCNLPKKRIIDEDEFMIVIKDGFPVTKHHTLIIPKRHVADYFGLHQPELNSLNSMLQKHKDLIIKKDKTVTGFNISKNYLILRAVMLLEDIPNAFDNVESF
jgi:ATP adenylyltransferase